ncbi:DUF4434 domain-containing protein [Planotetraspora mira]|uniref:DUF4434 domain-containing protein n=1 Tax=Planotetraspora mira TaxID=58121 RepID=A0A8J3TLK2_9ACTN|nr:DUF4434 domain-containing protein [Planotetraspora mira]GII28344.1 hypothetical protein Pmi06nite_17860 [Planotetraspora mira]
MTGFWVMPEKDPCTWQRQFEGVHQIGGDTVIRFGFKLSPREVDSQGRVLTEGPKKKAKPDARYGACKENGLTCVRAAEKDLKAANPGNKILRTYAYDTDERFGPGVFSCPSMEHKITVGTSVFYRLIVLPDGADNATCDFSKGTGYDLILVSGGATDSLSKLLDLGDRFGIKVFPSLPPSPRDADTFQADVRHIGPLTDLTRRVTRDYAMRFKGRASLGGVYQTYELALRNWPEPDRVGTLQVYSAQNRVVREEMPGVPIMVSPYMDARKKYSYSPTPGQVAEGFKVLAKTGVDIIAPQDGRGTGKLGLFWPNWTDQPVDSRLKPIVGDTTYAKAYHAATRGYFAAMSVAREELAKEGVNVQLWANLEAFQPTAVGRCGDQDYRGNINKPRLDTQVTLAGPYVSKIISYMWNGFYTCGSPPLSKQIAEDWDRPIPIAASRQSRQIQDGLQITGYHLGDAVVSVSWSTLKEPRKIDSAKVGWHDTTPIAGLPQGAEKVWVPFDWAAVPKNTWVQVEITSADGRKAAEPVYYDNGV